MQFFILKKIKNVVDTKNKVCYDKKAQMSGMKKYSRGRRGAPAKGIGRETGARVQIPPSPPIIQYSTLQERSIEQSGLENIT